MEVSTTQKTPVHEATLPPDNSLRVYLSRPTDPELCTFWVGVYKSGRGDTKEFLALKNLDAAFGFLQTTGLKENKPLMLSDNSEGEHRQYFLLPEKVLTESADAGRALILKTIESLGQKKCGLYLSSNSLTMGKGQEMLAQLIAGLSKTTVGEIHLLTGDIGANQLLNTSLYVKDRLKDIRSVWVFH